jgi:hypothetical protein
MSGRDLPVPKKGELSSELQKLVAASQFIASNWSTHAAFTIRSQRGTACFMRTQVLFDVRKLVISTVMTCMEEAMTDLISWIGGRLAGVHCMS